MRVGATNQHTIGSHARGFSGLSRDRSVQLPTESDEIEGEHQYSVASVIFEDEGTGKEIVVNFARTTLEVDTVPRELGAERRRNLGLGKTGTSHLGGLPPLYTTDLYPQVFSGGVAAAYVRERFGFSPVVHHLAPRSQGVSRCFAEAMTRHPDLWVKISLYTTRRFCDCYPLIPLIIRLLMIWRRPMRKTMSTGRLAMTAIAII